jgi:glycosyltransferase involved in cell wall biosynthesis
MTTEPQLIPSAPDQRLSIFVPCYNTREFLLAAVRRIPWDRLPANLVYSVLFVDNASTDGTREAIEQARAELGRRGVSTEAIFHPRNRGYGGSLKTAFSHALENGIDYLAIVHSDGQYAPEELPRLISKLVSEAGVCLLFGSRLAGNPVKGGMPVYRYLANHFLSGLQNLFSGLRLSEYHSGYRLYRLSLVERIPWRELADNFVVDNEIIFMIHRCGFEIAELPIPTHYGKEKSNVPKLGTPLAILWNLAQFFLCRVGLRHDPRYPKPATQGR